MKHPSLFFLLFLSLTLSIMAFDYQTGDILTFEDAAAVTPPAYAVPPGTPGMENGLFFGTFFQGVSGYWATHQVIYIGNDQFLGADGIGGVYIADKAFITARIIGDVYTVHRFNVYSVVPSWFPPCLANILRAIIIDRWIDKAAAYIGQPYDVGTGGRSFLLGNDAKYCSELIWQGFKDAWGVQLCPPVAAANLNYEPFAAILQALGVLPDQGIVTLQGIAESKYLTQVHGPTPGICP